MHSSFPSEKRDALAEELKIGNYDTIIGVHAPLAVRLAACKGVLGTTRLIGWIHNSYKALFGDGSTYIGPELRRHYEFQLAKLDTTIVLCQYDAKQYHIPTRVIYNPLTLQPGSPSQGNSKRFLAVGRFSHLHKGFDLLIDAFHLFAQKDSEWMLDIVGEGPEEELYHKKIAQYKLENRIQIHPFTNDVQAYYSQAQVYVLSSRWEGFGLVLVEAMAHGLPIVSSDLPTSREIMGDFALYFPNGNATALAQKLQEATLLDVKKKAPEAFSIARQFDLSIIAKQWQEILC
jgi:glycosyltransferase involved in cell wall biosynthesis